MKTKIKQAFSRAAASYDSVAYLQRNVAESLLKLIAQQNLTGVVVDLGCGTGFLTHAIATTPNSKLEQLIAMDIAQSMLYTSRAKLSDVADKLYYVCADAENLPFSSQSLDGVVSNLALQWCMPLNAALADLQRVLKANSPLIFSTFGTHTLCELKSAWASVDNAAHVNEFYSPAQLQLLLEQAGFSDIQINSQNYYSHYDSVLSLMRELKQLGAHSVLSGQSRQPTTRTALNKMQANYPHADNLHITATFEIITVIART
jgi:malonyl-CoA O-methyltransferase